jgi:hypothetical protein
MRLVYKNIFSDEDISAKSSPLVPHIPESEAE